MSARTNGEASIDYFMDLVEKCFGIEFFKLNGHQLTKSQMQRSRFIQSKETGEWVLVGLVCTVCNKGKHPDHFNNDSHMYMGKKARCKSCEAQYVREKADRVPNRYVRAEDFNALQQKLDLLISKLGGVE